MRMWMISPELLCRQHLLGEHYELHKLVGSINKKRSIKGYTLTGLIDTRKIRKRHDDLAEELERRGGFHLSPLAEFYVEPDGYVDEERSKSDLIKRCENCAKNLRTQTEDVM